MLTERQKGMLFIAASATGFAFLPTITRSLYLASDLQPTDVGFWRFVFANILFWAITLLRVGKPALRLPFALWKVAVLGVLYAASAMSAFVGLQLINASLYIVLFYTYPAMVAIISALLGARLSKWAWLAVGMTLIGCVLTIPDFSFLQGGNLLGVMTALFNALCVAVYYLVSARWMRETDAVHGTAWMMLATLLVIACLVPFTGLNAPANGNALALLIVLAIVSTVIPIFAINAALRVISAAQASIISTVEPVMAMLIALIVLGETILPLQWVGALIIVSAVIVLEASPKAK